jgi:hypothetical protein
MCMGVALTVARPGMSSPIGANSPPPFESSSPLVAGITLSPDELEAVTGYQQATKQLRVLHARGFLRAFISRKGGVVLERAHFDAVARGEVLTDSKGAAMAKPPKVANLAFLKERA